MTGAELRAWKDRHFGTHKGSHTEAARLCKVSRSSWYHMVGGSMEVPGTLEVLAWYVDRFGLVDDLGGAAQDVVDTKEAGA